MQLSSMKRPPFNQSFPKYQPLWLFFYIFLRCAFVMKKKTSEHDSGKQQKRMAQIFGRTLHPVELEGFAAFVFKDLKEPSSQAPEFRRLRRKITAPCALSFFRLA